MSEAVCTCPECGYESPGVEPGPNIGCGICPECKYNRMTRELTETSA